MLKTFYNEFSPFPAQWIRNLQAAGHIPQGVVDERDIRDIKPEDLAGYDNVDLFAGIAGWAYAFRLAGWPEWLPRWSASCPCQPFSSAGKRNGHEDERDLWPDTYRLIEAKRPPIIFGEQVASSDVVGSQLEASFVVAVQGGDYARANRIARELVRSRSFHFHARWITRIRADLGRAGYALRCMVLGSHSVGSPNIRQRLYWVAYAGRTGDERELRYRKAFGEDGAAEGETQQRKRCGPDLGRGGSVDRLEHPPLNGPDERRTESGGRGTAGGCGVGGVGGVGDADDARPQGRGILSERLGERSPWSSSLVIPCRDGKLRPISSQPGDEPLASGIPRDMGRGEPELRGLAKRARANRVGRLAGYGNAINPHVAAEFIGTVMDVLGIPQEFSELQPMRQP